MEETSETYGRLYFPIWQQQYLSSLPVHLQYDLVSLQNATVGTWAEKLLYMLCVKCFEPLGEAIEGHSLTFSLTLLRRDSTKHISF